VGIVSVLADISAVLVILEFMLLAVIPLVVLYFAIKGMSCLNKHLRPWLQQMQAGVNKVRDAVNRGARLVLKPFVALSICTAQVQAFFHSVSKIWSGKSSEV